MCPERQTGPEQQMGPEPETGPEQEIGRETERDPAPGSPEPALATLRRITTRRPRRVEGERCDMCAEPITQQHGHVVDLVHRRLLCTCRPCYLLFTDQQAALRYRAVPDRYGSVEQLAFTAADWDALQIPVGLVFAFHNSTQHRIVAFYPGPAGATESELAMDAWTAVLARNPGLAEVRPDVEAVLIRALDDPVRPFEAWVVPIDACYQLVGTLRQSWRGFDGGSEARAAIASFFDEVARRARSAGRALAEESS
jgi:Family of unknown function (DUF5947)